MHAYQYASLKELASPELEDCETCQEEEGLYDIVPKIWIIWRGVCAC